LRKLSSKQHQEQFMAWGEEEEEEEEESGEEEEEGEEEGEEPLSMEELHADDA
jgi:hypothetical protein